MYPSHSSRSQFLPPSSRRSSTTGETPLTAERAMMDQIRSKLERAQRRLARNGPTSSSSVSSQYIPSSEYNSAMHKPPVKSVLVEDMPATTSKHYSSRAPPSMRVPPSTANRGLPTRQGVSPPSRRPPPSKYDSSRYKQQQYKSRSKYNQDEADPLNGGPPPMSTPYLVYSSSKPLMTGNHPSSKRPEKSTGMMFGPPSAMRSGVPKPPTSRVRFEGHEEVAGKGKESEEERKRRHQQMKEREARHQRHRQKELEGVNARAKGAGPTSPIAAATRGRRSSSVEKPPGSAIDTAAFEEMDTRGRRSSSVEKPVTSAIKVSAYEEADTRRRSTSVEKPPPSAIDLAAFKKSPAGRPRRSSINNPPPRSDIDVAALNDAIPRRRGSSGQDHPVKMEENVDDPAVDENPKGNQKNIEAPTSVSLEPTDTNSSSGDESEEYEYGYDSDSSGYSDFDVGSDYDLSSSMYSGYPSTTQSEVIEEEDEEDNQDDPEGPESEIVLDTPPMSELSTVEEEPQPRITARDLAFLALGRASTSSLSVSDMGSPVPSANGKDSPKNTPAPMSYVPASSAFPNSRARTRSKMPATTGRATGRAMPPPAPSTNYIRRSRARAPMDLNNQLPPSIGVLSGLSNGSSTFTVDSSNFYEVVWKSGEFAFSVQRVYTDENEFEFDDRIPEPRLFLRMLLNTERSTCKSFDDVRVGDILIRVGDTNVSELGLEGDSGTVLTKFFAKLTAQTPIRLTFQRMSFNEWEGGVEL